MPAVPLVTVIGDLLEDVVVWARGPVRAGTDNPAAVHRTRGGSGANVAAAVAAAGGRARFVGRVGADASGDALVAQLTASGVDVRVQRAGRTGCVVVLVDEHGERTMFPDRAAAGELGPIDDADLDGTALVHIPLYGLVDPAVNVLDALRRVRADGGRISVDLSATSAIEAAGSVSALVDDLRPALVFANAAEAEAAGLGEVPPAGVTFVVKHGREPVVVVGDDGRPVAVPAEAIADVHDTTGAGDAFAGAFLVAWIAGAPAPDAARAGHRAAAAILSVPGAGPTPSP